MADFSGMEISSVVIHLAGYICIFLGLHGYSSVKEYAMGNVTRKVLNPAANMTDCIVP